MTSFKKGIAIVIAGVFAALTITTYAFPQGAVTLVQLVLGSPLAPVSSTNPIPVTAGSSGLGQVGGFDISIAFTPTVQNAAYSSGNAIGGLQTLTFFRTTTQPTGILNNVSVASKGGSTTAMTLYFFTANPSATTCTDKSAFSLGAADVAKLIPTIPIVLTPAVVGAGTTVTAASQQLPVSIKNSETTLSLYMCAVVGGSVTPASTSDLVFKVAGIQD